LSAEIKLAKSDKIVLISIELASVPDKLNNISISTRLLDVLSNSNEIA